MTEANDNPAPEAVTIADMLRTQRERKAFTQDDAALALQVSAKTYGLWERGQRFPQHIRRPIVAEWLGVELAAVGDGCMAGRRVLRGGAGG